MTHIFIIVFILQSIFNFELKSRDKAASEERLLPVLTLQHFGRFSLEHAHGQSVPVSSLMK